MKTSYLIIGGVVLLGAAYLYTHQKSPSSPAGTSPSSSTQQTTASKWLSATAGALQSFAGAFSKSSASTTTRTAPSGDDTALASAAHLEITNSIQL